MPENNFVTAGIEVDELISKKERCLEQIGNIIANACKSRAGKNNGSLENDLNNFVKTLPAEDQAVIYRKALVALSRSLNSNSGGSNKPKKTSRNDIFASRQFYN